LFDFVVLVLVSSVLSQEIGGVMTYYVSIAT